MTMIYMVECVYNDDGVKTSYIHATFDNEKDAVECANSGNAEFDRAKFYVIPIDSNC